MTETLTIQLPDARVVKRGQIPTVDINGNEATAENPRRNVGQYTVALPRGNNVNLPTVVIAEVKIGAVKTEDKSK